MTLTRLPPTHTLQNPRHCGKTMSTRRPTHGFEKGLRPLPRTPRTHATRTTHTTLHAPTPHATNTTRRARQASRLPRTSFPQVQAGGVAVLKDGVLLRPVRNQHSAPARAWYVLLWMSRFSRARAHTRSCGGARHLSVSRASRRASSTVGSAGSSGELRGEGGGGRQRGGKALRACTRQRLAGSPFPPRGTAYLPASLRSERSMAVTCERYHSFGGPGGGGRAAAVAAKKWCAASAVGLATAPAVSAASATRRTSIASCASAGAACQARAVGGPCAVRTDARVCTSSSHAHMHALARMCHIHGLPPPCAGRRCAGVRQPTRAGRRL